MSVALLTTTAALAGAIAGHGFDAVPPTQAAHSARSTATAADVGASAPARWCGTATPSDDVVDELDNGPMKYHAIYAVPADAPDRFADFAPTIQAGAMGASALIERLRGRAIRFDMGTPCGKRFLDISDVRLRRTTAEWAAAAQDEATFATALNEELRAAGFGVMSPARRHGRGTSAADQLRRLVRPRRRRHLRPGHPLRATRAAAPTTLNAWGGKVAVVFRVGDSFCSADGVRHEIGHTLGALVPAAAHAFDGAHCNDAAEDTMCYPGSPSVTDGPFRVQYFDYGDDDYWGPLDALDGRPQPVPLPGRHLQPPGRRRDRRLRGPARHTPPRGRGVVVKVRTGAPRPLAHRRLPQPRADAAHRRALPRPRADARDRAPVNRGRPPRPLPPAAARGDRDRPPLGRRDRYFSRKALIRSSYLPVSRL